MKNYVVPFFCSCRYIQQQYRYALSPDTMESENKQTNIAIFCPFHASTITIVYIQPFTLKCYLDIYKDYDVYIYILRGQAFFPNFKWAGSQIPTLHQEASGFWALFHGLQHVLYLHEGWLSSFKFSLGMQGLYWLCYFANLAACMIHCTCGSCTLVPAPCKVSLIKPGDPLSEYISIHYTHWP